MKYLTNLIRSIERVVILLLIILGQCFDTYSRYIKENLDDTSGMFILAGIFCTAIGLAFLIICNIDIIKGKEEGNKRYAWYDFLVATLIIISPHIFMFLWDLY